MLFRSGVRRNAGRGRDFQIAAPVMIVGGMQRLVYVTDEVQEKLQREPSLRIIGRRALELRSEFVDLIDDAVIGRPQDAGVSLGKTGRP